MKNLKPNDIIPVGFRRGEDVELRGEDVELICTDNGLLYLPEPVRKSEKSGNYTTVIVAQTPENLIALRLCGVDVSQVVGRPALSSVGSPSP